MSTDDILLEPSKSPMDDAMDAERKDAIVDVTERNMVSARNATNLEREGRERERERGRELEREKGRELERRGES
jgi:hypothetical protein